jgi:hypothetical protein
MARTIPAIRQVLYSTLLTVSYPVNNAAPIALPAASVRAGKQYLGNATPPEPFVTYEVWDAGVTTLNLLERRVRIKITASSGVVGGDDVVTEILEAARALLVSTAEGVSSLSRVATSSTLQAVLHEVRPTGEMSAAYDESSQRWYGSIELSAVAQ